MRAMPSLAAAAARFASIFGITSRSSFFSISGSFFSAMGGEDGRPSEKKADQKNQNQTRIWGAAPPINSLHPTRRTMYAKGPKPVYSSKGGCDGKI